jgi:hypothetical protein
MAQKTAGTLKRPMPGIAIAAITLSTRLQCCREGHS